MKRGYTALVPLAVLLLIAVGPAMAQSGPLSGGTISAADLLDKKVETRDGERIGSVSDLIVDTTGNVAYVVVSHDGVRGFNDRLTPIPVSAFDQQIGRDALVVDLDRSRLESAPHFAKRDWPPNYDRERWESWDRDVRGYYATDRRDGGYVHGTAGGVGPGGSDSPDNPGVGSVEGSGERGKTQ